MAEIRRILFPPQEDPKYEMHAKALENRIVDVLEQIHKENNMDQSESESGPNEEDYEIDYGYDNGFNNNDRKTKVLNFLDLLLSPVAQPGGKRSIATLAKNGQLPSPQPDTEMGASSSDDENEHKRNVASMARIGGLNGKRGIQSVMRQAQAGKRNIASMSRNGLVLLPGGKRNLASIKGKRNVGTLARDSVLPRLVYNRINELDPG